MPGRYLNSKPQIGQSELWRLVWLTGLAGACYPMIMGAQWHISVAAVSLLVCGCPQQEQASPARDQVKIGDLAPKGEGKPPPLLNTTNLDVHVFQVPAERVRQLRGLWDALHTDAFQYGNHQAFRSNAFRVARGSVQQWDWIVGSLTEAGASRGRTVSVWLTADEENDMTVAALGRAQKVTFHGKDGQFQGLTIGPGRLALRLWTDNVPSPSPARRLVGYPVFTRGTRGPIPKLAALAKDKEVAFVGAAFSTPIQEGDIVVLGPEEYYGDASTLGGLFFSDPQGQISLKPGSRVPVQKKGAVRIYAIVCTRLPKETL